MHLCIAMVKCDHEFSVSLVGTIGRLCCNKKYTKKEKKRTHYVQDRFEVMGQYR